MNNNKSMWVIGHKITPHNPTGNYDMVIGETPPNVPGPPPHHHKNLNELFFVLEGEMEFLVNGKLQWREISAGVTQFCDNCVQVFPRTTVVTADGVLRRN